MSGLLTFPGAVARDAAVNAWFDSRRRELGAAREWFLRMPRPGSPVDTAALQALITAAYLDIKACLGVPLHA